MGKLALRNDRALKLISQLETDVAIKPLEKEIFLDDVFVCGVLLHSEKLADLKKNDLLFLQREKQPYDDMIVAVYRGDIKLGELDENEERIFARLLDAGKKLTGKVKNVVIMPEYSGLEISITMVDF